jgi:serine phosphatase RsbU (regulator of sigma subunit)
MVWMRAQFLAFAVQLPWIGNSALLPLARQLQSAAIIPAILIFTVLLASRFRRVRDERDDLTSEMDAARAVQRMLVREHAVQVPGYTLEAAYLPSKDVSGDFYQILPADDGSLLVVVGDVSGKGLEAAMLGAAVMGALGDLASRQPADVLAHLNRSLRGKTRGGFVTCCCALFYADGRAEVANAGHIPPYLDGREVEVDPGPPLGIAEDATYETAAVSAALNAVTFLSDGVLEATNAKGEMLGFERLAALTIQPARDIANEAERWGQEDDITVVKVAYA